MALTKADKEWLREMVRKEIERALARADEQTTPIGFIAPIEVEE